MMRINNSFSAQYQPIKQKSLNSKSNSPAFGAGEAEFIEMLGNFKNKDLGQGNFLARLQLLARLADKKHTELNKFLTVFKGNKNTDPHVKSFVETEIEPLIGAGGVQVIGKETKVTRFLDRIFGK